MAIVVVFFIVYLVIKVKATCAFGYRFASLDLRDSGTYVNASGGILGIGVLFYVYVTCPGVSTLKRSTVFALAYLVLFLSLCLNVLIRLKVPKGVTTHYIDK